jgi:hypothetical protein
VRPLGSTIAIAAVAALISACASDPASPVTSPLYGLTPAMVGDSVGNPPPTSPAPEPGVGGQFRGTVVGSESFPPGTDTLAAAPRLANVRITVYTQLSGGALPTVGPIVATMTTGSSGAFDFPSLPGGDYVVAFVPPAGSPYYGIWVTSTAHAASGLFSWWVVLGRR